MHGYRVTFRRPVSGSVCRRICGPRLVPGMCCRAAAQPAGLALVLAVDVSATKQINLDKLLEARLIRERNAP